MTNILRAARRLGRDRKGVTALEYALIAAFTAVAIIAALTALSGRLQGVFNAIANALNVGG